MKLTDALGVPNTPIIFQKFEMFEVLFFGVIVSLKLLEFVAQIFLHKRAVTLSPVGIFTA